MNPSLFILPVANRWALPLSLSLLVHFHWPYAFKFSLNATQTKDMVIDFQSKAAHQKRLSVKLQGLKKLSLEFFKKNLDSVL